MLHLKKDQKPTNAQYIENETILHRLIDQLVRQRIKPYMTR